MSYRITGLDPAPSRHPYGRSDAELGRHGVEGHRADAKPGFPDRVERRDAEPGEGLPLLNRTHQPAATPRPASHAIFVLEGAEHVYDEVGRTPEPLRHHVISVRAFDLGHPMVDADLVDGRELEGAVGRMFDDPGVGCIQAHYAKRGCYAARVERA